jgi:zinc transporter
MTSSSDTNGIRHACLLDGKGGLLPIEPSELDDWEPSRGALWLHLDLTSDWTLNWLAEKSGLDPLAVEALATVESRPRVTRLGKGILLAFRGVNLNEGAAAADMIGIRVWLDEHRVITSQRRQLRSVGDVVQALSLGEGAVSPAGIVTELARRLVTRMSDTVDTLEELIADLEDQTLRASNRETRFALANLRRQIIALRRYLAPQREALASLLVLKLPWLSDEDKLSLRETNDRLMRHLEDLDAIRERAAVTQEEIQSRLAEQQNVRMYVLSIVAAIFLPLGFLTGLLGINVGGIPGAENPASFWIFVGMLLVVVTLLLAYFRRQKWF